MERDTRSIKPIAYCAVIFLTIGVAFANVALARFGLEGNSIAVFSVAFLLAAFLLSKNPLMVLLVIVGVLSLNVSDATLLRYNFDRDVLLAMVCAAIMVPSLYEIISK